MVRAFLVRGTAALALLVLGIGVGAPAWAGKPWWAGGGMGAVHVERQWQRLGWSHASHAHRAEHYFGGHGPGVSVHAHFGDRQREAIHDYYAQRLHAGNCPPGLAMKHNGCMPPGQARTWAVGERLPDDVTFYALPPQLVVELGVPPVGYRYVRVASDVLLIAAGTGMVVDAISDLSQR